MAEEYFELLARTLPVCCLSDEFYFMPRAEAARRHWQVVDHLETDHLEDLCKKVRGLKGRVDAVQEDGAPGLAGLLGQSMAAFLLHFETLRIWERDPGFYLKVTMIGLDQALLGGTEERALLYEIRLDAIPRLLSWGAHQLVRVPEPSKAAALDMVKSCGEFLSSVAAERRRRGGRRGGDKDRETEQKERRAQEALHRFRECLLGLSAQDTFTMGEDLFQVILEQGYGWAGGLREAREILEQETADAEETLAQLAKGIAAGKDWQEVYRTIAVPKGDFPSVLSLYREEVGRLEAFFRDRDILPMPPAGSVVVEPTPAFLQPIRATASYAAPNCLNGGEGGGRFFVLTGEDEEQDVAAFEASHREYRYLSAHETYPGHHMLDWARLHLSDPVRCQIESALFYEGWACYAEQLVDECGYDPDPRQYLIRTKRELWRAVRGRLDLGLHTGAVSLEKASEWLGALLGYGVREAEKQARRYTLTPGYQLCYTLGKRRLLDLRRRFVPPLSLKEFHAVTLTSGQVPFEDLEEALESVAAR
jgi:hypothetical protein